MSLLPTRIEGKLIPVSRARQLNELHETSWISLLGARVRGAPYTARDHFDPRATRYLVARDDTPESERRDEERSGEETLAKKYGLRRGPFRYLARKSRENRLGSAAAFLAGRYAN